MKKNRIATFFLFLFLVISCSETTRNPELDSTHVVLGQDINKSILVFAPEGWNTYKVNEPVALAVVLQTPIPVYVSEDNILIDVLIGDTWRSVNKVERESVFEQVIYFHELEAQRLASLDVKIDLSDTPYPHGGLFRFLVIGYTYENQTKGQKVFGFADVELFP